MSGKIQLKIAVDDKEVGKIDNANKKLKSLQSSKAITSGVDKVNNLASGAGKAGINLGGIGQFASKLSGVTKLIGPVGIAFTAIATAATAFVKTMNGMIEKGKQSYDDYEQAVAKTRVQSQAYAPGMDAEQLVSDFEIAAENGVASLDHLTSTFNNLLPVLDGNVEKGKELTLLLADMEAAGKGTADSYTELIAKVKLHGDLQEKDLRRLETQGLPIYRELAKVRGEEEEATRSAVRAGKVASDEFISALKNVAEAYKGTAAALSSTTEGAKASMEAAKGRAYRGAAEGAGIVLKGYYTGEQARYDALASDPVRQQEIKDAAMNFQAGVVKFDKICNRLENGLENAFGWIASKLGWKREVVADYADDTVKSAKEYRADYQKNTNEYRASEKTDKDLQEYLAKQLPILQAMSKLGDEMLRNPLASEALEYVQMVNKKANSKDPFERRAARELRMDDKYIEYKRITDARKDIISTWDAMVEQANEVLSQHTSAPKLKKEMITSDEQISDLSAYYQSLTKQIKQIEDNKEKAELEAEKGKTNNTSIMQLYDAYAERAIKNNKQDLLENGDLDKYRSKLYHAHSGYVTEGEGIKTKIDWGRIMDAVRKDAIEKDLQEWLSKELFAEFTNVDAILQDVGAGGVGYADAKQYVVDFETKLGELYSAIQDKTGADRYRAAHDKMKELFGQNAVPPIETEDDLKAAIEKHVNAYNAINKAMEEVSKTAAEYIEVQEKKFKEQRDKILAEKRNAELKTLEYEQFTKSDAYNSLKSYKRKLEKQTGEDGYPLYTDKEVKELVRKMGNKMLRDAKKGVKNTDYDSIDGRWVNASRADAATGYLGQKIAGYNIKDKQTEQQLKEAKEANKTLTKIETAIKEIDNTPRAV